MRKTSRTALFLSLMLLAGTAAAEPSAAKVRAVARSAALGSAAAVPAKSISERNRAVLDVLRMLSFPLLYLDSEIDVLGSGGGGRRFLVRLGGRGRIAGAVSFVG